MTMENTPDDSTKNRQKFLHELRQLILKFVVIAVILVIVLGYVFGLTRNLSLNMQPAFQDGDLIVFYRIKHNYGAGDTVVIRYEGKNLTERVIAVAGDTVDITSSGLMVNGSYVQEPQVIGETTAYEEGVSFPLTVGSDEIFVLGDNRMYAVDSRIFGCVAKDAVKGRIIGLFRRRNF
ncbi:MAG: signal peptidase I [Mogibacterium sp.]|nr:signal peptidase I [Mogibacterium sp.]